MDFYQKFSCALKAGTTDIEMSTLSVVPLIDFAKCGVKVENNLDDKQVLDVGEQLYGALQDCGFVYLKHTGISLGDITKVSSVAYKVLVAPWNRKRKMEQWQGVVTMVILEISTLPTLTITRKHLLFNAVL